MFACPSVFHQELKQQKDILTKSYEDALGSFSSLNHKLLAPPSNLPGVTESHIYIFK